MPQNARYPSLSGRAILVTGGGSGIGADIVRAFATQGAKVGFIDLKADVSRSLADELAREGVTVHFEVADLADVPATKEAIDRLRSALGEPVTALVNNAGHDERHAFDEVTPDYWDNRFAVNLRHQFFCAQAVVPDMRAAGGGAIINMGSVAWMAGLGGMAAYTASKSAVVGLTRSLARDLGTSNIRVNSVAPGAIMTQRQLDLWITPEAEADIQRRQCLKRRLIGADVAALVLFLASDDASACTGQTYIVDGGLV